MSTILETRVKQTVERTSLSEWLPYEAYDEKNRVYRMDDGRIGILWASRPILGLDEGRIQKLTNLFESDLPIGTTFQFMLHASPIIEPCLDQHVVLAERGTQSPEHHTAARAKKEFYLHARDTSLIPNPPLKPRDITLYVSITMPVKDINPDGWDEESVYQALDGIEEQLRTMGLLPQRVPPLQFLWLLHVLLNPGHSWNDRPPGYSDEILLRDQAVRLDTVMNVKTKMLELDNKFVKTMTIQSWPLHWHGGRNREFIGSLMKLTDQLICPFFITLNVLKLDQVSEKARFNKKHLVISNQAKGLFLNLIPVFRSKLEHSNAMAVEIENSRQFIGQFFQVAIYADSPRQAQQQADSMKSIYRAMDINLQDDFFIGLKIFLCGLPMALPSDAKLLRDGLRRLKTVHTAVPAHCAPLVGDWKGGGSPVLLYTSRSGQVVSLDLFANQQGNYNFSAIATSGAGKSFWMNDLIENYLQVGGRGWIIDAGYSYVKLCELRKGQYIQYAKQGAKLCFNPFSKLVHWGDGSSAYDDDYADEMERAKDRADEFWSLVAIHAQMVSPSQKLNDVQMALLEEAIQLVLQDEGNRGTPTHVMVRLRESKDDRAQDMALVLQKFSKGGMYEHLFNRVNNINFENDLVVMEMDGLGDQKALGSVLLLSVQMSIQSAMFEKANKGRRKFLVMDEAWDLLSDGGNCGPFFEKAVRRVRKYGGSIGTITQNIDDYDVKMKEVGMALLGNSDFKLLLKQHPESIESMRRTGKIKLNDFEYSLLESVDRGRGYSEIFAITPFGRGVVRLVVPRQTQLLYTTDPDELHMIAQVRKEHGEDLSITEVIKIMIQEEHRRNGQSGRTT